MTSSRISTLTNSVIVMPAAHRPEMMALSLESLRTALTSATGSTTSIKTNIYLDSTGKNNLADYEFVRDTYFPDARIILQPEHPDYPSGSWNILHTIKAGYETSAEFVYFLEEDVRVRPSYFPWVTDQFSQHAYAAVCPRRDPRFWRHFPGFYTNPGSVLPRATAAEVSRHVVPAYFMDMRGYLDREFGPLDQHTVLDDGLIRRVCLRLGECKFPDGENHCIHQGWGMYGKIDRYMNNEGDIQTRIARLREMITTVKNTDRYAPDFEVF